MDDSPKTKPKKQQQQWRHQQGWRRQFIPQMFIYTSMCICECVYVYIYVSNPATTKRWQYILPSIEEEKNHKVHKKLIKCKMLNVERHRWFWSQ